MPDISEVPGVTGTTLELFEAAGIWSLETFLALDASKVVAALDRANDLYDEPLRRPSKELVQAWQEAGHALLRKRDRGHLVAREVPLADLEKAGVDIMGLPSAEPAKLPPARTVSTSPRLVEKEQGRSAAKALGPLLKKPVSEARSKAATPSKRKQSKDSTANPPNEPARPEASTEPRKSHLPVASVNRPASRREQPAQDDDDDVEVSSQKFRVLEAVKQEEPQGERRNRGMSHPEAYRVRFAATVTVLGLLASLATGMFLLWAMVRAQFYGDTFHPSIALLLIVFPVALFFYLAVGAKVRCRLCGQRLFVPRHCRKHVSAAKSIFGPTFAVARNAMLFGSYRCMLCGTKTRLKD